MDNRRGISDNAAIIVVIIAITLMCVVSMLCSSCVNQSEISTHGCRLDSITDNSLICYDKVLNKEVNIPYSSKLFGISLDDLKKETEIIETPMGYATTNYVVVHIVFELVYSNGLYYRD